MKTISIDSKSHQAIRHQGTEKRHYGVIPKRPNYTNFKDKRLLGFKKALNQNNFKMEILNIEKESLNNSSVLIIASRADILKFNSQELSNIRKYFNDGGNILLMANHKDFVHPQNQIAKDIYLPIEFQGKTLKNQKWKLSNHQISYKCTKGIKIRISCTMTFEPNDNISILASNDEVGPLAVAIELSGKGRLIAITSAGHIASRDDNKSDLFSNASNSIWTLNMIKWLTERSKRA